MKNLLEGVHPRLIEKIERVLKAMEALGQPMFVCQGVRTTEQQQALYAQGRTRPGAVVTKADGVVNKSNHQVKADGFGHAVDCAFQNGEPFGEFQPWKTYGACCDAVGLIWGGSWKTILDRPHAELPL